MFAFLVSRWFYIPVFQLHLLESFTSRNIPFYFDYTACQSYVLPLDHLTTVPTPPRNAASCGSVIHPFHDGMPCQSGE